METIRQLALRRFLVLGLGLVAGLAAGVYEFLKGELPPAGFGIVLVLMMVGFLAGISLVLRAASRRVRQHLAHSPAETVPDQELQAISILTLLRNKSR